MRYPKFSTLLAPTLLSLAMFAGATQAAAPLRPPQGYLAPVDKFKTGDKSEAACPALVTVIYNTPEDGTAFEAYYSATHVPLVGAGQSEIGFTRRDLTKFDSNLDGSAPAKYRQAELCFNSMDELKKGVATPAFKKVGDDLPNFATGGLTALIGEQK